MTTQNISPEMLADMSDEEIDAMLLGNLAESSEFAELVAAGQVKLPEDAVEDEPVPELQLIDPSTGTVIMDEPEEIDADSVPDEAVTSSVGGHTSTVDHAMIGTFFDDAVPVEDDTRDDSGEDAGDGPIDFDTLPTVHEGAPPTSVGFEEDGEEATYAPEQPVIPEADENAAPRMEAVSNVSSPDRPSATSSAMGTAKGFGGKVKGWFVGLSGLNRALLIAGGVIALIIVLIVATSGGGGDEVTSRPDAGGSGPVADDAPAPAPDTPSGPAVINDLIKTTSAGSCASPSTQAKLAFSTDDSNAWVCGRSQGIDGAVLNITFREPVKISEVTFTPGFDYVRQPSGDDSWGKYRVTTRVLWRMGGKQIVQENVPSRTPATLTLDEPVTTTAMSLTIQKSVDPEDADETGGGGLFSDDEEEAVDVHDATAIQGIEIVGEPVR